MVVGTLYAAMILVELVPVVGGHQRWTWAPETAAGCYIWWHSVKQKIAGLRIGAITILADSSQLGGRNKDD